ncbi:MAG: class I adenylate-forming enzyme family protein [Acidimicrobiia bacterium]
MTATIATVGDVVALGASRTPGRVAVAARDGRRAAYADLDERTTRLANALIGVGLGPGDRVAAWMEDCVEYVELYLATAKAGLVVVPVNARFTPAEAHHVLDDSQAAALVWTAGLGGAVESLGLSAGEMITVSTGGGAEHDFERLLAAGAPRRPPPPDPDDLYIIGYTSGTTGLPKGAVLTHRSVLAISRLNALSYRLPIGSVAALTGSMSFVATVPAHIICHLYVGGSTVVMGAWDVDGLLDVIARERVTFTYVPSPLLGDFTEAAARRPEALAPLESVLHSASRAEPERLAALCEVIGDRFVEGWGMTENSGGLATATTRADAAGRTDAADVFSSVGQAVVESAVEVVGPDGSPLPHDGASIGELVIRSPALMAGYWNNAEASAAALRDGWYHSGDLGALDPAGYVYITERRHDLIVSGGMNVYPSEVERCLRALVGVRDCAVVGVPHARWGQTVAAVLVAEPAARLSEQAVVEHSRRHLASYKKPTHVLFADGLPRTANHKLDRNRLRREVMERLGALTGAAPGR